MPSIVTLAASQRIAPTPPTLQKTGAFISQGATNIPVGTYALLTQLSDVTPILVNAPLAITSLSWSGGVVTGTTTAPHGFTNGDTVFLSIIGASPAGYNGEHPCLITGASTFTYPHSGTLSSPATGTITYVDADAPQLLAQATTFFGQGSKQGVYVLELGPGTVQEGVTALTTFINAQAQFFYSYLVPREWDNAAPFLAYLASFEAQTAKTYFWITTTISTYTNYTPLQKCVFWQVEAPGIPTLEFSLAADFWRWLQYSPSTTSKITPFDFGFVFGVTPYPTIGNGALLAAISAANGSYIGTGAEGGISNTIIVGGTMADGNDATYWYSTDWLQINLDEAISNAVINGSNDPLNPLYYNQDGINRLQEVGVDVLNSGITFGMVLGSVAQTELDGPEFDQNLDNGDYDGQAVINAVPFLIYSKENPGDYKIGEYDGLAAAAIPQRGFKHLVFNLNISNFVSQ